MLCPKIQQDVFEVFGETLCELAEQDRTICAISAAMTSGTGLASFAKRFPDRFYDVGIAEQHAVTLAAGLAVGGMNPFVALYSTFFQRAYDQWVHDVCLQNLPVTLALDRAGLVASDGETHQGLYDLSMLLPLPNVEIFAPADAHDLRQALVYACSANHPVAIRYPRTRTTEIEPLNTARRTLSQHGGDTLHALRLVQQGSDLTVIVLGAVLEEACSALSKINNLSCALYSCACARPFDFNGMMAALKQSKNLLLIEEGSCRGGWGASLIPEIKRRCPEVVVSLLGIPVSSAGQASRRELLKASGLDADSIADTIRSIMGQHKGD